MNILIVDDLIAIVESLKNGIQWNDVGISEVFTANSVPEAKLLIINFDIDILLTDIEMPGENGLDLVQWISDNNYKICSIFLTSHADFTYAQRALKLGVFDYIMQPVRYVDVENVVMRAIDEVYRCKKNGLREMAWNELRDCRSIFLDAILRQFRNHDYYAAEVIMSQLLSVLELDKERVIVQGLRLVTNSVSVCNGQKMDVQISNLIHVIENSFGMRQVIVCVSHSSTEGFYVLILCDKNLYDENKFQKSLYTMSKNVKNEISEDIIVCVSKAMEISEQKYLKNLELTYMKTRYIDAQNECTILWDTEEAQEENLEYKNVIMEKAINYIQIHISKNITRADVAAEVCLSEAYFSKFFKQCTGWNFKEYVLNEKMKVGKSLLINSNLPISLIAAKLGFSNFSHFSKTFKKITDWTPQEYRKKYQK